MSEYAKLSSQMNHPRIEESDIFLTINNPLSDPVTVNWKIRFPFPVVPTNKTSGTIQLDPYGNQVISWTTGLAQYPASQRQGLSDQEIVVELRLMAAGGAFQDGTRNTLNQLGKR